MKADVIQGLLSINPYITGMMPQRRQKKRKKEKGSEGEGGGGGAEDDDDTYYHALATFSNHISHNVLPRFVAVPCCC
jgi:hypothetical protein